MVKIYLEKKPINVFCNIDISVLVVEGLSSPCIICSSPFNRSIRVRGKVAYDCPRYKFNFHIQLVERMFYDSSYCQSMCTSQIDHLKEWKKTRTVLHIYPLLTKRYQQKLIDFLFVCCFMFHSRIFTPRRTLPYARHSW